MGLSNKSKRGAELLAKDPTLTGKALAEAIEVTPQALCNWKKKDEWNAYYEDCLKAEWKSYGQKAQKLMWDKANDGDYRAIEYICSSAGLKGTDKIEVDSEGLQIKVTIEDDDSQS